LKKVFGLVTLALVGTVQADTGVFNYLLHGEDWHDGACATGTT